MASEQEVRICKHCGKPMLQYFGMQKYHTECAVEVNRLRSAKISTRKFAERLIREAYGDIRQRKQAETYDLDTNGLIGIEGLAKAVVDQAMDDWRWLCKGNEETYWCSFDELKYFFKHESGLFIRSENGTEQRLWEKMQEERRLSGY